MAKRISDCSSSFFFSSLPVVVGLELVVGATMAAEEEEEAEATEDVEFVLNVYFCRELKFVAILRSKLKIYTQK